MTQDELLARESIRHTMASYTMAGDRLRVEDFIAVFTEDGILQSDGVPEEDSFCYNGRKEIKGWMTRWLEQAADSSAPTHQATFVRHHLATSLVEFVDQSTAKTRTYWTAYTDIGADHCGYYVDVFHKQGDRWLLAHRKIRLDWRSPQSLMFSAISRSR